jgi:hypothetical protein
MVDYLACRLSGVYIAGSRKGTPPPDLAQFKPRTNNFEFLQDVAPNAAEYTKRHPVAPVQKRKRATLSQDVLRILEPQERYKQGESLTQSMTREFGFEFARQAARNILYEGRQPPVTSIHEQRWPPVSSSYFLIPTGNESEIFGFRGHMCSKCLMIEHLAVSYSIDSHTDARVEVKHYCRPDILANNRNLDDNVRTSSVEHMRNILPSYLKKVVSLWGGEKVILIALELPGESPPTSEPTANDQIRIHYPRNLKILIRFHRTVEKQVELKPGGTKNPNHWSSRVVRQGRTVLTQHELEEFLELQNASFGIFKLDVGNKNNYNDIREKSAPQQQQEQGRTQERNIRYYFMYISKISEIWK